MDTVKRGPMLRQVRGPGTLVPEARDPLHLGRDRRPRRAARRSCRARRSSPTSILLEMSNPELERDALDAESQLQGGAGRARPTSRCALRARASWTSRPRPRRSSPTSTRPSCQAADERGPLQGGPRRRADAQALARCAPRSSRRATRSRRSASRVVRRRRRRRRVAVQEAHVEQLKALADLKRSQKDALHVRAGISGVLQELPVQVGQQRHAGRRSRRSPSRRS